MALVLFTLLLVAQTGLLLVYWQTICPCMLSSPCFAYRLNTLTILQGLLTTVGMLPVRIWSTSSKTFIKVMLMLLLTSVAFAVMFLGPPLSVIYVYFSTKGLLTTVMVIFRLSRWALIKRNLLLFSLRRLPIISRFNAPNVSECIPDACVALF